MNMKPILTHREFIYLYLLVIKSSTVHGDLQTFTERHCCLVLSHLRNLSLLSWQLPPKRLKRIHLLLKLNLIPSLNCQRLLPCQLRNLCSSQPWRRRRMSKYVLTIFGYFCMLSCCTVDTVYRCPLTARTMKVLCCLTRPHLRRRITFPPRPKQKRVYSEAALQ